MYSYPHSEYSHITMKKNVASYLKGVESPRKIARVICDFLFKRCDDARDSWRLAQDVTT